MLLVSGVVPSMIVLRPRTVGWESVSSCRGVRKAKVYILGRKERTGMTNNPICVDLLRLPSTCSESIWLVLERLGLLVLARYRIVISSLLSIVTHSCDAE